MKLEYILCFLAVTLIFFAHNIQAAPSLDSQRLFEDVEKTLAKSPAVTSKQSREVASQVLSESEILELDQVMDGRIPYVELDMDETTGPGDQK
jgi:hypothetical protein